MAHRVQVGRFEGSNNFIHAVSLRFMYYTFDGFHKTLRVKSTIEARVSDRVCGWLKNAEVGGLIS
jgi:hypothetical protein